MLASETAPHTAVSTGTHSALLALGELRTVAAVEPGAIPFISIAAWGLGPTRPYITGFFARLFVSVATALFWSKPLTDFEKQLAEVEEAKEKGLIRPTLILPPILNDREKTDTYRSGEASMMKEAMGVTNFVSRASMADLCLKLGRRWHRARRCRNGSASQALKEKASGRAASARPALSAYRHLCASLQDPRSAWLTCNSGLVTLSILPTFYATQRALPADREEVAVSRFT